MIASGNGSVSSKRSGVDRLAKLSVEDLQAVSDGEMTRRPIRDEVIQAASMSLPVERSTLALVQRLKASMPRTHRRAWGYSAVSDQVDIREPEYDLREIKRAISVESYFQKAVKTHVDRIMQSGWTLQGSNKRSIAYVYRRLRELSRSGGYTLHDLWYKVLNSIVSTSNAILYWVRQDTTKAGRDLYKNRFGEQVGKVKGLFTLPVEMMKARTDKYLNITAWEQHQQEGGGQVKKFLNRDIVHIYHDQMDGFIFGTPFILACLDDALSLRRAEDLQQIRAHKMSFPLLHGKVGTDDHPLRKDRGGNGELHSFLREIERLNYEGILVTDHRHLLEAVDTSKSGYDLTEDIKYYRGRLLEGLGLEGSSGGGMTGQTSRTDQLKLTEASLEMSRSFQTTFESAVTEFIITELLIEGGFGEDIDDQVFFKFNELDRIAMAIRENQVAAIFQSNLMTYEEARIEIGREPLQSGDERLSQTNYKMFVEPLAKLKTVATQQGNGSSSATTNRTKPSNQSGTKMGKTTTVNASLDPLFEATFDAANLDLTTEVGRALAEVLIVDHVKSSFDKGVECFNTEFGYHADINEEVVPNLVSKVIETAVEGISDKNLARDLLLNSVPHIEVHCLHQGYIAAAGDRPVSWYSDAENKSSLVEDSLDSPFEDARLTCQDWKKASHYELTVAGLINDGLALTPSLKKSKVPFDQLIDGRYPVYDEASAYNLFTFLSADKKTPIAEKSAIKEKLDKRLEELDLTYDDLTTYFKTATEPWGEVKWSSAQDVEQEHRLASEGQLPVADAVLSSSARKNLPGSAFCGPDRSFPAHDASHVRNALARLPQSNLNSSQKARVKSCLTRKAKKFGVKVSDETDAPEIQDCGSTDAYMHESSATRPLYLWDVRPIWEDSSVIVRWDWYADGHPGGVGDRHVQFSVTDGKDKETVYDLYLGNDNEIKKGKSKAKDAVYVTPRSFKLLDMPDGAYQINMWVAEGDGSVAPEFKDTDTETRGFVMDTAAGHHEAYGDGSHRHDGSAADRDGHHEHPHPPSNPFGLHIHDGQEEPTGAHIHDYDNGYGGPHPFETPGGVPGEGD